MTTKPNLAIYDFEGELERAFAKYLLSLGVVPEADKQGGSAVMQTPRIEAKFVSSGVNETHRVQIGTNQYASRWDGVLHVKTVTERSTDSIAKKHRPCVAAVRWAGLYPAEHLQPYLKMHTLTYIKETATNPAIETGWNYDISTISFNIVIAIMPAAFPQP